MKTLQNEPETFIKTSIIVSYNIDVHISTNHLHKVAFFRFGEILLIEGSRNDSEAYQY